MSDCMTFPDSVDEFMEEYKMVDTEHIYSNGTEYVPIFRMKQWFEHLPSAEPEIIRCKDCKHMIINEKHEAKPMICCFTKMCGTTEPDWFCTDGERRTDESSSDVNDGK